MTWITPILQSNLWIFRQFSHCVRYRTWRLSRFFFLLRLATPQRCRSLCLSRRYLCHSQHGVCYWLTIVIISLMVSFLSMACSCLHLSIWCCGSLLFLLSICRQETSQSVLPGRRNDWRHHCLSLWLQIIVLIYVCTNNHNIIFVTARPQVNRLWLMSPRLVQTILRWLTSNRIAKGEKDGNFTGWAGFSLASRVRGSLRPRALAYSQSYGRRSGGGGGGCGSNSGVHLNVYVCVHVVYWDPLSFM